MHIDEANYKMSIKVAAQISLLIAGAALFSVAVLVHFRQKGLGVDFNLAAERNHTTRIPRYTHSSVS